MFATEHHEALRYSLSRAYLEVIPARGIEKRLECLPERAYVAITCSPTKGVDATLELAERMSSKHLRLVPHVAARTVRDRCHLQDILHRLEALEVDSVFVPGGDREQPIGKYASSLQLLRDMAELGHGIRDIGVAAYPEGHPLIDSEELQHALLAKQEFASYMVTQMCFDAATIIRWLRVMRERGVRLQAWLGLPGVAERSKLLATSLRIGVGDSTRFLAKQPKIAAELLKHKIYRPDALLAELSPHLADTVLQVSGFHLYSFNQIENTENWRVEMLEALQQ